MHLIVPELAQIFSSQKADGRRIDIFTCGEVRARRSMDDIWPYDDLEIVTSRGQRSLAAG